MGGDEVYPYPSRNAYARRTESPYTRGLCGPRAHRPTCSRFPATTTGSTAWWRSRAPSAGPSAVSPVAARARRAAISRWRCRATGGCWASTCSWARISTSRRCAISSDVAAQMGAARQRRSSACPSRSGCTKCTYPRYEAYTARTLDYFCSARCCSDRCGVMLTGDLHFYRRAANAEGAQKIIAGGGGAFLHPSHQPRCTEAAGRASASSRHATRTVHLGAPGVGQPAVPLHQSEGRLAAALVYALSAWLASSRLDLADIDTFRPGLRTAALAVAVRDPLLRPVAAVRDRGAGVLHRHALTRVPGPWRRAACDCTPVRGAGAGVARDAASPSRSLQLTYGRSAAAAACRCADLRQLVALVGGLVIGLYLLISMQRVRPACAMKRFRHCASRTTSSGCVCASTATGC